MSAGALASDPVLQAVVRASLALLLAGAALHKLRDREGFRTALAGYGLLSSGTVAAVGWVLPLAEGLAALALLAPGAGPVRAAPALALLWLYGGAVAAGLARGRAGIDCGCGGGAPQPLGPALLARNLLLLALAGSCALPVQPRALGPLDLFCVASATLATALLYATAQRALALAPRLRALRGLP